jgi:hypothetical protein
MPAQRYSQASDVPADVRRIRDAEKGWECR